ncbi:excinuclease ATPase subunit [Vibrio natriegens]|uniref:excinuclease ATPase subunit n=1 Tax=Vibrio natriegens TaxID=691 RepID=UPI000804261F|nr:excinuclease ATPase subunit [Vibrio natriegens]ANQ25108.1 excinuclease ATPase subunit [Vibrio natriegens]MCY9876025.1 excinuclease ATPase subunit [Vibrio natriegens]
MKLSLLAIAVGSIILVGCNDSSTDTISFSKDVRAFDGAVQGMTAQFDCIDGSGGAINGTTDYDGLITIENETFATSPEDCSVTFNKTPGAVDTSNGKDMSNVSYSVPKGLLQVGQKAAATPLTTIIAKELGDDVYSEDVARKTLGKLGIDVDNLINDGADINIFELLTDPETALDAIKEANPLAYSQVMVTTVVLSDTLAAQGENNSDVTVDQLVDVARRVSAKVLEDHPNYPENDNGDEIYVDLSEALEDDAVFSEIANAEQDEDIDLTDPIFDKITDDIASARPSVPVPDPERPSTGGTGGTGGSGSEGGGGA